MVYVPCKTQHGEDAGISLYRDGNESVTEYYENNNVIVQSNLLNKTEKITIIKNRGNAYNFIFDFLRKQSFFSTVFDAHCWALIH